ncbi:YraN family protein [Candidatus Peregrinibacteria bacterium]|nr:YraN family protein [Candidatus Peregrinibacteria bacterium]
MKAKSLGYKGEDLAARYLQDKGYKILEKNFTVRGGEVDLVAQDGGVLVFVEAKTRTGTSFGTGDESVNFGKKQKLRHTIQRYIAEKPNLADSDYRVDLVEIELDSQSHELKKINHLKDIEI